MKLVELVVYIVLGALAGLLSDKIMKKGQKSFLLNLLLGIAGALVGGYLAGRLNIGGGLIVQFLIAVAGACLITFVVGLFRKK